MSEQYGYNSGGYGGGYGGHTFAGEWANSGSSQYGGFGDRPGHYPPSIGSSSITLSNPYQSDQYGGSQDPYYSRQSSRGIGYDETSRGLDDDKEYTGTPVYPCLFYEVCSQSFYTKRSWMQHVNTHLPADGLPDYWPKAWQCRFPRCYERPFYDDDAFALWHKKLDHIATHLEAYENIKSMEEELSYVKIFREIGLVKRKNHDQGYNPAQQFRNQGTGPVKHAPDFQQAQDMEDWNMQKRAHHPPAPHLQDENFRPGISRSQTVPVNYVNAPVYGVPNYLPNPGPHDPQQYGRPPFEHHAMSDPPAHPYPLPPNNYNYGHMPPPPAPHTQYTT